MVHVSTHVRVSRHPRIGLHISLVSTKHPSRAKPWILSLRGILWYPTTFQSLLVTPLVSILCLPRPKHPTLSIFANLDLHLPVLPQKRFVRIRETRITSRKICTRTVILGSWTGKPGVIPAGPDASSIQPSSAVCYRVRPFTDDGPDILGLKSRDTA